MTGSDLKHLVERLDASSSLFLQCALILPELDTAAVDLQITKGHITADMAPIYRRRFRHLSSNKIANGGVELACEYFAHNICQGMRFALVETASFKGYAFINPELSDLLAFPHAAKTR
jgi:hypothetical protein